MMKSLKVNYACPKRAAAMKDEAKLWIKKCCKINNCFFSKPVDFSDEFGTRVPDYGLQYLLVGL